MERKGTTVVALALCTLFLVFYIVQDESGTLRDEQIILKEDVDAQGRPAVQEATATTAAKASAAKARSAADVELLQHIDWRDAVKLGHTVVAGDMHNKKPNKASTAMNAAPAHKTVVGKPATMTQTSHTVATATWAQLDAAAAAAAAAHVATGAHVPVASPAAAAAEVKAQQKVAQQKKPSKKDNVAKEESPAEKFQDAVFAKPKKDGIHRTPEQEAAKKKMDGLMNKPMKQWEQGLAKTYGGVFKNYPGAPKPPAASKKTDSKHVELTGTETTMHTQETADVTAASNPAVNATAVNDALHSLNDIDGDDSPSPDVTSPGDELVKELLGTTHPAPQDDFAPPTPPPSPQPTYPPNPLARMTYPENLEWLSMHGSKMKMQEYAWHESDINEATNKCDAINIEKQIDCGQAMCDAGDTPECGGLCEDIKKGELYLTPMDGDKFYTASEVDVKERQAKQEAAAVENSHKENKVKADTNAHTQFVKEAAIEAVKSEYYEEKDAKVNFHQTMEDVKAQAIKATKDFDDEMASTEATEKDTKVDNTQKMIEEHMHECHVEATNVEAICIATEKNEKVKEAAGSAALMQEAIKEEEEAAEEGPEALANEQAAKQEEHDKAVKELDDKAAVALPPGLPKGDFEWDLAKPCDGGAGEFTQHVKYYEKVVVGTIPKGKTGIRIDLQAKEDVDIELWDGETGEGIIAFMEGKIDAASQTCGEHRGQEICYSGYFGVVRDGWNQYGEEWITITGATEAPYIIKAFGFASGDAKVSYSWTGKQDDPGCENPAIPPIVHPNATMNAMLSVVADADEAATEAAAFTTATWAQLDATVAAAAAPVDYAASAALLQETPLSTSNAAVSSSSSDAVVPESDADTLLQTKVANGRALLSKRPTPRQAQRRIHDRKAAMKNLKAEQNLQHSLLAAQQLTGTIAVDFPQLQMGTGSGSGMNEPIDLPYTGDGTDYPAPDPADIANAQQCVVEADQAEGECVTAYEQETTKQHEENEKAFKVDHNSTIANEAAQKVAAAEQHEHLIEEYSKDGTAKAAELQQQWEDLSAALGKETKEKSAEMAEKAKLEADRRAAEKAHKDTAPERLEKERQAKAKPECAGITSKVVSSCHETADDGYRQCKQIYDNVPHSMHPQRPLDPFAGVVDLDVKEDSNSTSPVTGATEVSLLADLEVTPDMEAH